MISIQAIKVPSYIPNKYYRTLLSSVSMEKRQKINRFKHKSDAYRSLLADLLIRSEICSKYRISNNEIKFTFNKYGKPFYMGDKTFFFNLSHSGEWVVCVWASSKVGIDVEQILPIDLDIAKHFYSTEEVDDLFRKPQSDQISYFYDLWTLKESYMKALGIGMSLPTDTFTIKKLKEKDIIIKTEDNISSSYWFKQYFIDSNYKLSLCTSVNQFPKKIDYRDLFEIYRKLQS